MIAAATIRLVDACRRHALAVVLLALAAAIACGVYVVTNIRIDTDTGKLIAEDLPWRQRERAFDRAFPQTTSLLTVVVDAATPDLADDAAARLTERMRQRPELFRFVRRPDGGPFFERNGLLFLPVEELESLAAHLVDAQPMIGALAADPSLRGLFEAFDLALEGVARGEAKAADLDRPFAAMADAVESIGGPAIRPVSWRQLFTDNAPKPSDTRRFVLAQAVRDYGQLASGAAALGFVREAARDQQLVPERGVRVRLTGAVALEAEEFATVAEGTGLAMVLSLGLVSLLLYLGLRSTRMMACIFVTLVVGLIATAAFATAAFGRLNLISVAFAVLFVGIAVDFGIQFGTRFRDRYHRPVDLAGALRETADGIGKPLLLAAAATAIGFLSFVPTDYVGVSELGMIAGIGVLLAIVLNLTLLPALIALLKPHGARRPLGFTWARGIDEALLRHRAKVIAAAAATGLLGAVLLPQLRFDFNPLHLKDPRTESVATLNDLIADPATSPYSISTMAGNDAEAARLSARLSALPEVDYAVSIASFVPADQERKLAVIDDLAQLLEPTLKPPAVAPAPTEEALRAAATRIVARLRETFATAPADAPALRLARALEGATQRAAPFDALRLALLSGLQRQLATLSLALQAGPVSLETLPDDLKREWIAPDGRRRVEIFPKGALRDNDAITGFVGAVATVTPEISGAPITIRESARSIVQAFSSAAVYAMAAITILAWLVLRRVADVLHVLAPVILAGAWTVITSVVAGIPLNFANIIALPLMLGIGVAFSIYFVMSWRAGESGLLQSSLARAVVFSALTTASAFGSLWTSSHPGTSDMGKLLTIVLGYTLIATLLVLPALMGPAPRPGRAATAQAPADGAAGRG